MRAPANAVMIPGKCHEGQCCKILAMKTMGIMAVGKLLYDKYSTPVHPGEGAVAPHPVPAPAMMPAVHAPKPCGLLSFLGYSQCGRDAIACPIKDPVRWCLQNRERGTYAVAQTRQWLRSAADTSASPGVLATVGAASAIPTAAVTLSAPALWLAAVTMFTVGALDASYRAGVQREVRAQMRQLAEAEAARKAAWPTTMTGVWELAQESAASMAAASLLSYARKRPTWASSASAAPATSVTSAGPALHLLDVQRYLMSLRVVV
jgi:hypothetical protein